MFTHQTPTVLAFGSVLIVSAVSLICIAALLINRANLSRVIPILVALAIGALSGDALIHLLPEAFVASSSSLRVSLLALAGFFSAFLFEFWMNQKRELKGETAFLLGIRPPAMINLLASSTHNFIDGMLIGSAFLSSRTAGFATTLAIIFHEIPHELGDFGILVGSGLEVKTAVLLNCLSALIAILGTAAALWIESVFQGSDQWVLPFTAGTFLYLAGPALLPPLLVHPEFRRDRWHLLAVVGGILMMALLKG